MRGRPRSLTWTDHDDGAWRGTFANYDKVQDGQTEPYGRTDNTLLVRMNDDFDVVSSWIFPADLVDRFRPMSNSGGSWGPDGRLHITGHDDPDVYVIELPAAGSVVPWVATISPGHRGSSSRRATDLAQPQLVASDSGAALVGAAVTEAEVLPLLFVAFGAVVGAAVGAGVAAGGGAVMAFCTTWCM